MIRKIVAVVAGYLVFALSAGAWFLLMGHPPHADAPLSFKLMTALCEDLHNEMYYQKMAFFFPDC